jgi:F0F1-type ATP synthase alpha subunit
VPADKVKAYEDQVMAALESRGKDLLKILEEKKALDDTSKPMLVQFLKDFGSQFAAQV